MLVVFDRNIVFQLKQTSIAVIEFQRRHVRGFPYLVCSRTRHYSCGNFSAKYETRLFLSYASCQLFCIRWTRSHAERWRKWSKLLSYLFYNKYPLSYTYKKFYKITRLTLFVWIKVRRQTFGELPNTAKANANQTIVNINWFFWPIIVAKVFAERA